MSKIAALLNELEAKMVHAEKANQAVSEANIGWHIDHSLKVINSVVSTLKNSEPKRYKPIFNLKRSYFLLVKKIPRGKIKAPKAVRSYEEITTEDLTRQLETARSITADLSSLDKKKHFTHPFLGQFNLTQTLAFLELHTKHHLKIINDILQ